MKKMCKRSLALLLTLVMVLSITISANITANAASNPYPPYNYYNSASDYQIACTWYAWKQANERLGLSLPVWGNGGDWYDKASGYSKGGTAKANSIACWAATSQDPWGHVAYVTGVNSNGSINIVEGGSGWSGNNHGVCSRTVSPGRYWPDQGFIYLQPTDTISVREGVYVIHSVRDSNKVLDIQSDSKDCGANIQLYVNLYNQVQKFRIINKGDYYCIQSVYSGMWLDISLPYNKEGANIQLWDTNTSIEQKWVFEDAGNGNVYIHSLGGMYLDTDSGSTANGTNIETFHFDGTTSQQWTLEWTSPCERIEVTDGIYTFHNVRNPAKVMDIQGNSKENKANIQLYDDQQNEVQRFKIKKEKEENSNNYYYLIQSVYSGYWLDIASPFNTSGCNIQLWKDHNSIEEKWVFEDAGNGQILIRSLYGTYVDLKDGATDNNTNIQTYSYDGTTSMKWVLHRVYAVDYNANGGSNAPAPQGKQQGILLTLSAEKPIRSGYTFVGWNTKSDGTGTSYSAGGTYKANAAATLYAQWTKNASLTSIAVKTLPTKTVYDVGESFRSAGLTLIASYSDGSTQSVTSGFACTGFTSDMAGTKTVTVTYGGQSTTFTVTVVGTTVTIADFRSERTEHYKTSVRFYAATEKAPANTTVHWFVNGADVGTGNEYTVRQPKEDYTVQAKLLDSNGQTVAESETETVHVRHDLWSRLRALIQWLFGVDYVVNQRENDLLASVQDA